MRLMADDGNRVFIVVVRRGPAVEPVDQPVVITIGTQRLHDLDARNAECWSDDLGRFARAHERARCEHRHLPNYGAQSLRATAHLRPSSVGQRTLIVAAPRRREVLLVFSDRVSNDEQVHENDDMAWTRLNALGLVLAPNRD